MANYILAISTKTENFKTLDETVDMFNRREYAVKVVNDLKDTLRANKDVVALAAPQIGEYARIFCIKFANGDIRAFINPMISKTEGLHLTRERCASLPGREFIVPRNDRIIAMYQTPTGKAEENIFEGVVGEIFQQMVNLLDGVTIDRIGLEVFEDFDKASDEERKEVLDMYIESLKKRDEQEQKDIENDEDLKQTRDAIEFSTQVATGQIDIAPVDKDGKILVDKSRQTLIKKAEEMRKQNKKN